MGVSDTALRLVGIDQSKIPAYAINLQQRFWCFLPQDMQRLWQPILALSLRNHAAVWVLGYGPRQAPNPRVRVACAYARQSAQPYDDRSAGDLRSEEHTSELQSLR